MSSQNFEYTTSLPFNPNSRIFPLRRNIPKRKDAPDEAAWVWGENDQLGRLNLLTPTRIAYAAKLIKSGEIVSLNLPLDIHDKPAFGRSAFKHTLISIDDGTFFDDIYFMNTQSSTQWDGFRHVVHRPSGLFYNGVTRTDIVGESANSRGGIGSWADHGIAGRGVLIDYWSYAEARNISYDPFEYHAISYEDLAACGLWQGIDLRPKAQGGDIEIGDILFLRSGQTCVERRRGTGKEMEVADVGGAGHTEEFHGVGLKQEAAIIDWLHDCYFAAVAGDSVTFEAWPSQENYMLHEYILALFGMPLGELFDLEKLSQLCKERHQWFFFVTSALNNLATGVASNGNALAIL